MKDYITLVSTAISLVNLKYLRNEKKFICHTHVYNNKKKKKYGSNKIINQIKEKSSESGCL